MSSLPCNHWVIGDVHGCYQPLQRLLSALPKSDHVVFCGDVINRGPDTPSTMHLVWSLVTAGRATWLRGNHEQALLQTVSEASLTSPNPWLKQLDQLPDVFQGDGWLATHAGFDANGSPNLTIRETFWEHYDGSRGLVVIGHTPRADVERHGQIVMIDTGAVYGGKLSAYCPETEAVVQVEGSTGGYGCSTQPDGPIDPGRALLTVYRSNRTEFLATLLAQTLTLDPPGPFEELEIVVNTWPTSRWLGEQLAKANGISALVRFPFPGSRLRQLVRCILDLDPANEDPWRAERLVWSVLKVLPDLLEHPTAESLKLWWEQHASVPGQLNRDHWQLARCLADAVDDYALYRPQELSQWIEGHGDADLPAHLRWQPQLVRALAASLPCDPFGLQVQKAVERLRAGDVPAAALPPRLRLFGISNLAPVQVELLQGLSGLMAIELYLLTPCPELWQRSEQRRQTLGQAWNTPPDGPWLLESPRLEALLGRMGAEFQLLLEGNGDCFLGQWDQGDLFAAPIQIAASEGRPATLLEQVQQQLVDGSAPPLTPADQDRSLRFLACAGPWREVQLVRDQILQWLASDPSLEPRDVLVMTPDVERYAPLLTSVFGDQDATGVSIPWRLTDRSQQSTPGLSQGFMALLRLATERLTASGLEALLSNPALQVLQGITATDAVRITQCLQQTGFRWGVNGEERGWR